MRNAGCFIGGNDLSAIGCMKALIDMGYHVPEDISVIGFDDISIASYFNPKLSTFKTPSACRESRLRKNADRHDRT